MPSHRTFFIIFGLFLFFAYDYFFNNLILEEIEFDQASVTSNKTGLIIFSVQNANEKPNSNRSFVIDYENDQFLKDGQPFRYVSGSMHYFRVPRAYWRDRLRKFRAAGLSAVSTYVEWATHEPSPGHYKFTDEQDVEYFLQAAAQENMLVILRPGPYACAERDMGGLPAWLMTLYPNIALRTNDTDYMKEVKKWFDILFPKLQKYLYGNGGPVIMVQVENEYGCGFCNMEYKLWLRDLMKSYVQENAILFTADPSDCLKCGFIPDVYATTNFQPGTNLDRVFEQLRQYSPHGPLICSEFYDGWFSSWEVKRAQNSIDTVLSTTKQMLDRKMNFNFYMFEGGTNFGFSAGAITYGPGYNAQTTSYDYDTALDESGDPTPKYYALRKLLSKYFELPKIPAPKPAPKSKYGAVTMKPVLSVFDYSSIPEAKLFESNSTKSFEELGHYYGYVLYETTIPEDMPDPALLSASGMKDRANVFVNKKPVAVLSASRKIYNTMLEPIPEARLSLLVENQGRITSAGKDTKGLLQTPTLNGKQLNSWKMVTLPFENITWTYNLKPVGYHVRPPAVYVGELVLPSSETPLDTFVDPTGWGKGILFVNGILLGRYWPSIGGQVNLYVPGCYLHPAPYKNIITMFETEYTQAEYKIVFTDKPNLNKIPPTPIDNPQLSALYRRQHISSDGVMVEEHIDVADPKKHEETEMTPKKRTKRETTDTNEKINRSFVIDYENDRFLKDGQPFRYICGSIHYMRIPKCYWQDRLNTLKDAGLNCVDTYVEWSSHNPKPDVYTFDDNLDIEYFLQLANQTGLIVILRVGPYICAERDFGGLPYWLITLYPNIILRTNNTDYMNEVRKWFDVLLPKMQNYLYGNWGPVALIQVENEYGYTGMCNIPYKIFLRDLIKSYSQDKAVLFTVDTTNAQLLKCGSIEGVYATIDFGSGTNVTQAFEIMRTVTPRGPFVCSEFYSGRRNSWEVPKTIIPIPLVLDTLKQLLDIGASFSFYMFCGGTNFGFKNGANGDCNSYLPILTSYDNDVPMNESGDPTEKYYAVRNLISQYVPLNDTPTPVPKPKGNYGSVTMRPLLSVFNYSLIPDAYTITSDTVLTFEELNLSYGYVLYETVVPQNLPDPAVLTLCNLKDRAYIYINQKFQVIFSRSRKFYSLPLLAPPGRNLAIMVENQGRINFGGCLKDEKGLLNSPTLNEDILGPWTITALPFQNITWTRSTEPCDSETKPPALYIGTLVLPENESPPMDTFFNATGWGKGFVFINDYNIGRYWPQIGSQVTLYVPGCYLLPAPQVNYIVMFETEYTPPDYKITLTDMSELNKIPPVRSDGSFGSCDFCNSSCFCEE